MNRTLSVVRMQLINKQTYIWIPLIILGGAFVLALAVYAILAELRRRRARSTAAARRRRSGTSASSASRRSRSPSRSRRR